MRLARSFLLLLLTAFLLLAPVAMLLSAAPPAPQEERANLDKSETPWINDGVMEWNGM